MHTARWLVLSLALVACADDSPEDPGDTDTDGTDTLVDDTDVVDTDVVDTDVVDTDPIIPDPMDVTITPAEPVAGEPLNCSADTTTQASYTWSRDGVPAGISGPTVLLDVTDAYESWTCAAITVDGLYAGEASVDVGEACKAHHTDGTSTYSLLAPVTPTGGGRPLIERYTRAFTLEAWVYRERDDVVEDVIHRAGLINNAASVTDYALRFTDDGKLQFITGGADDDCATLTVDAPGKDAWHHIAASWEPTSNRKRLFIDGLVATTCESDSRPSNVLLPGTFNVGGSLRAEGLNPVIDNPFQGSVDEVRLSAVERYTTPFVPVAYHASDADTLVLLHMNEQRTYGMAPDDYEGTPDASPNQWSMRLADITDVIGDTRSACDTIPAP